MSGDQRQRTSEAAPVPGQGIGQEKEHPGIRRRRDLRSLVILRPYILRHPFALAAALAGLLTSALAMLAVPLAVRRMIDHGFGASDSAFIDRYFVMLIVIGLVLAAASAVRFYFVNWLGERVITDLGRDVFSHLARLGPAFFERVQSGELMSRLTADTAQIKAAAGSALSQALRNSVMFLGALALMIVTSPALSALVLVAIPAIVLPLVALGRIVRQRSRHAQDDLASASAFAAENLASIQTMSAFGSEAEASSRFAAALESAFAAARRRLIARAGLTALAIGLVVSSTVGVLWFGAAVVVDGGMTGGRLGQFVLYALFAAGAMAELSEVWGEINQAAGAAERLAELLAMVPAIRSPANPITMPKPAVGEIAFRDVRFAYPSRPEAPVLAGLSFRVAPGEKVALVGPSGAGKTTIFNLLFRFWDPDSGAIEVDGVDVRRAGLAELRSRLALVPQDVALFAGTIADAIHYGRPGATPADVRLAAAAAHAEEFILRLPEGFDTQVGERGVTLSGGQRQRVAIARAILRNAPILLLDEATSALDAESEMLMRRALDVVIEGRTTLIIAHRLATVQNADRILVIDGGRVAEEGTHGELVRRGGLYRRLADLQFTGEAA